MPDTVEVLTSGLRRAVRVILRSSSRPRGPAARPNGGASQWLPRRPPAPDRSSLGRDLADGSGHYGQWSGESGWEGARRRGRPGRMCTRGTGDSAEAQPSVSNPLRSGPQEYGAVPVLSWKAPVDGQQRELARIPAPARSSLVSHVPLNSGDRGGSGLRVPLAFGLLKSPPPPVSQLLAAPASSAVRDLPIPKPPRVDLGLPRVAEHPLCPACQQRYLQLGPTWRDCLKL